MLRFLLSIIFILTHIWAADISDALKALESKNYPKVLSILQPLAEKGNNEAKYYLGLMFFYGEGVTENKNKAEELLENAAKNDLMEAQVFLGIYYIDSNNSKRGLYWLEKAVTKNNNIALFALGKAYVIGQNIPKDIPKGLNMIEKSANLNNPDAQHFLASTYQYGYFTKVDMQKSFEWTKKAADNNHTQSVYRLAQMHLNGVGTPKDITKGIKIHEQLAEENYFDSLVFLGITYFEGNYNIQKDFTKAGKYFQKAIEYGEKDNLNLIFAQYLYSLLLIDGKGVNQDKVKAYNFLLPCAKFNETNPPDFVKNNPNYTEGMQMMRSLKSQCQKTLDSLCSSSPWVCK